MAELLYKSDPNSNPIMQFFEFDHLPADLASISKPICLLADDLNGWLPHSAEKTAGLRKLLEAKDCFVRAKLMAMNADKGGR